MSEQIRIGIYTLRRVESDLRDDAGRPIALIQILHKSGEGGDYPEEAFERWIRFFVGK